MEGRKSMATRPPLRAAPARRGSFGRITSSLRNNKEKACRWLHGDDSAVQKRNNASGSKGQRKVARAKKVQLMQWFSKKGSSKSVLRLRGDLDTGSKTIAQDSPRAKRKRAEELAAACMGNPKIPQMPVPSASPLLDSPSALKLRKMSDAEEAAVTTECEGEVLPIVDAGKPDHHCISDEGTGNDPSRLSPTNDVVVLELDEDAEEPTIKSSEESFEDITEGTEEHDEQRTDEHGHEQKSDSLSVRISSFECKDSHVVFIVQVTTLSNTWELQKRYSEFLTIYDMVKERLGAPPIPFPPKLWSSNPSEEQLEERKVQLEEFISEALSRPLSAEAWSELQTFFEIPENCVDGEFVLV